MNVNSNILLCKQKSQRQTYCIFWNVRLGTCLFLCANKKPSLFFRWSRCCHLHRHPPDVYHARWCNYPNSYWYVLFHKHKVLQGQFAESISINNHSTAAINVHPQLSMRLVATATWPSGTAERYPVKLFPTVPAICHGRTPCTCSETPSLETFPGPGWLWGSPYWPHGTGVLTR